MQLTIPGVLRPTPAEVGRRCGIGARRAIGRRLRRLADDAWPTLGVWELIEEEVGRELTDDDKRECVKAYRAEVCEQ